VKEKEEKGSARGSVPVFRVCVCVCVCLLLQDLVQSCLHGVWGEGDMGGHVLRKTTSRDLCGLVCPSRTSERGGEGDCVKEGGCVCVRRGCMFITAGPSTKLFTWGTSRGLFGHHALVNAGEREIV
jgi:hypothetical protein